jgi:hypothetical protein
MHERFAYLVIVGLLFPLSANADPTAAFGVGAARCAEYSAIDAMAPDRDVYAQWTSGFLVALSARSTHELPAELDQAGVARALRAACAENPARSIFAAAGSIAAKYDLLK